jgi:hypothetical protein
MKIVPDKNFKTYGRILRPYLGEQFYRLFSRDAFFESWLGFKLNGLRFLVIFLSPSRRRCSVTRHEGAWGERRYSSYSFSTSALDGGEWLASRPGRALPQGKRPPGTHWTGGWVGPRAGLDAEARGKILCLCRGSKPSPLEANAEIMPANRPKPRPFRSCLFTSSWLSSHLFRCYITITMITVPLNNIRIALHFCLFTWRVPTRPIWNRM